MPRNIKRLVRRPKRFVKRLKRVGIKAKIRLERSLDRDAVTYDDVKLPPPYLRSNGVHHREDKAFLESSRVEAQRLADDFAIGSASYVLDIGCGAGRLPLGLIDVNPVAGYLGVDVSGRLVDWCQRHITRDHPDYRFTRITVRNERYSSDGAALHETLELPADDKSFDVVYSHSVLPALSAKDTRTYLRVFRRYLKPGGSVFLTAFVELDVDPVTERYPYPLERGTRGVTLWSERGFRQTVSAEGLTVDRLELHTELDNQAAVHLTLPE